MKKKNIVLGILLIILMIAGILFYYDNFNNKKIPKSKTEQMVLQWIGRDINLVDSLPVYDVRTKTFYNFGKLKLNRKKIVVHIDSECFTCVEDFVIWKNVIEELGESDVQLLFYLHTTDFDQIKKYLIRWNFNYPVIIDRSNTFFNVNQISDNKLYKAMLLDIDNKVEIIGNPIVSNRIKEFYFMEIKK